MMQYAPIGYPHATFLNQPFLVSNGSFYVVEAPQPVLFSADYDSHLLSGCATISHTISLEDLKADVRMNLGQVSSYLSFGMMGQASECFQGVLAKAFIAEGAGDFRGAAEILEIGARACHDFGMIPNRGACTHKMEALAQSAEKTGDFRGAAEIKSIEARAWHDFGMIPNRDACTHKMEALAQMVEKLKFSSSGL